MKKLIIFLAGSLMSFGAVGMAQTSEVETSKSHEPFLPSFQARMGAGITNQPSTFMMSAELAYRPDDYVSLGPDVQWGLGDLQDYFFPTFGGRFIVPRSCFEHLWGRGKMGVEVSLRLGMGPMFREVTGVRFRNFGFESALTVDLFFNEWLGVGIQGVTNITSSNVDDVFPGVLGSMTARF